MKRISSILPWFLLAAFVLSACGASISDTPPTAGSYTADDDGAVVNLVKGDTFDVYLPMDKDAEEYWQIGTLDSEVIQPKGKPVQVQSETGDQIQLRFKATKAGEAGLQLIYLKEGDAEPRKTFTLFVKVAEK
ncbi:MAG: protease inhibitor I42 family protein [Anaerolineaceae bacterium]